MALDSSEKMLNDYKNEFYDIMKRTIHNELGNVLVKKKLNELKTKINRTLSYSSGEEREKLGKIIEFEMGYLNEFTKNGIKGTIASRIPDEIVAKLIERIAGDDNDNSDQEKQEQKTANSEQQEEKVVNEKKDDLNKINVKRVSELEERIEELKTGYRELDNSITFDNMEDKLKDISKYIADFNEILKEMKKIYKKTAKNSKEFLPNVKNEEDRKKWIQENKSLLDKINSNIPYLENIIRNTITDEVILRKQIEAKLEANSEKEKTEESTSKDFEEDKKNEDVFTEDQYYDELVQDYLQENEENELFAKQEDLYSEYMGYEDINPEEFAEETKNFENSDSDDNTDNEEIKEEEFEELIFDPIDDKKFKKAFVNHKNSSEFVVDDEEDFEESDLEPIDDDEIDEEDFEESDLEPIDNDEIDEEDFEESDLEPIDDDEIDEEDFEESDLEPIDDNEIDEEDFEESDLEPIDDNEIDEEESEVDKRIKKYIDFSKIKSEKEVVNKLNTIRGSISKDVIENPKKYREIRKVFKRIYYDDLDFNGDIFTSNLFAEDTPQYLGGKMYRDDHERLKESIELYKQMSTEGKIPQNEIDTFDKYVLAPYELQHITIEKEENEMVKNLKSQTKAHEEIDDEYEEIEKEEFVIDDEDLNI